MKTIIQHISTRLVGLFILTAVLSACDTSGSFSGDDGADSATFEQTVSFLAADLGLNSTETAALSASFAKFGDGSADGDREPGFLWRVADNLQATLTDEQKARLFERLEQMRDRGQQGQGMRPGQNGQGQNGQRRPGMGGPGMSGPGGQGQGDGPRSGFAQLDLSDDQQAAIKDIRESYKDDIQAVVAQRETLSRDEIKEQLEMLHESIRAEIEAVLTTDQLQQLEDLKAEAEARRAERQAEMEANREAAKVVMIEVLGLTTDQIAALDDLRASREADRESIRELKDSGASEEDVKAAAVAFRAANEAALNIILDDTQLEITMIHQVLAMRLRNHRQGGPGQKGQGGPGGQGGQRGFGGPGGQGGPGGAGRPAVHG